MDIALVAADPPQDYAGGYSQCNSGDMHRTHLTETDVSQLAMLGTGRHGKALHHLEFSSGLSLEHRSHQFIDMVPCV